MIEMDTGGEVLEVVKRMLAIQYGVTVEQIEAREEIPVDERVGLCRGEFVCVQQVRRINSQA